MCYLTFTPSEPVSLTPAVTGFSSSISPSSIHMPFFAVNVATSTQNDPRIAMTMPISRSTTFRSVLNLRLGMVLGQVWFPSDT